MTEAKRTGRPPFTPTLEQRESVKLWIAGGLSQNDIAKLFGIKVDTLRKHFREELTTGSAEIRARVLDASYASAMAGNVSAQNKLLTRFDTILDARKPKVEKVGKREERQQNAEKSAGVGIFALPKPPKLVVNN